MQLEKLLPLLKASVPNITEIWREEVRKVDHLQTYNALNDDDLFAKGEKLLRNLVWWLEAGAKDHKAEEYFIQIGSDRFEERFPLAEVIYAVYLAKKVVWGSSVWRNQIGESIESNEVFDFATILNNYFDLANFQITRGYFNKLFQRIDDTPDISIEDVKKILMNRKPEDVDFDLDEMIWRHV